MQHEKAAFRQRMVPLCCSRSSNASIDIEKNVACWELADSQLFNLQEMIGRGKEIKLGSSEPRRSCC